jgi:hypothetical protein
LMPHIVLEMLKMADDTVAAAAWKTGVPEIRSDSSCNLQFAVAVDAPSKTGHKQRHTWHLARVWWIYCTYSTYHTFIYDGQTIPRTTHLSCLPDCTMTNHS